MNEILELSLRNAREHRDDMARWLALEVLLNDPAALEDPVLEEHLYHLQDKIEAKLRAADVAAATRQTAVNGFRPNAAHIAELPSLVVPGSARHSSTGTRPGSTSSVPAKNRDCGSNGVFRPRSRRA